MPLTPDSVDRLHQLSERFDALGRPMPQHRIIEEALYRLSAEYKAEPLLHVSREVLDLRYSEFLNDGGKPARDAVRQVVVHLDRKRIRQQE